MKRCQASDISVISIHALLAESDGVHYDNYNLHCVISIHALLAESDIVIFRKRDTPSQFLSTLSLRRATIKVGENLIDRKHFYPRSPCGERHGFITRGQLPAPFLSTLSLRRATTTKKVSSTRLYVFLSTLSLRRATTCVMADLVSCEFLSTLSLRRATKRPTVEFSSYEISIHALLAESDAIGKWDKNDFGNFYPRSPCGERQKNPSKLAKTSYFYPRSPCGERRRRSVKLFRQNYISIHALLAESDITLQYAQHFTTLFLSTLSLRRATPSTTRRLTNMIISIHALLAESDIDRVFPEP